MMGWASGSRLFSTIISETKPRIANFHDRKDFYAAIIAIFECDDWDTQDECMGEDDAYDAALKQLHPDWYDDD